MDSPPAAAKTSGVSLRVHFAPLGFEVDRIVAPAVALRADAMILLAESARGRARPTLERVTRRLDRRNIPHPIQACDLWDPPSVVNAVGSVASVAPHHQYFFNVSTGAKTACIGGTIASMFWRVRPYYQPVVYIDGPPSGREPPIDGPPRFIPTFEMPVLDRGTVDTLTFLVNHTRPVSKRELMSHMLGAETIRPKGKSCVSPQALHAQADTILHRLASWGFVEAQGRRRGLRITATETGRGGARMFRHVLEPRPLPTALNA
jgi:hypothetical protein